MKIERGSIRDSVGHKLVIYGVEGIGKTTLAGKLPDPLYIDCEGSTTRYDVARVRPKNWNDIESTCREVLGSPGTYCKTLVIDTIDWAMSFMADKVCQDNNKKSIESFGYGCGYKYLNEALERFLCLLSEITLTGTHVCITAHSKRRKVELVETTGAFDKYELKLDRGNASTSSSELIKEWADTVLFCNYKVDLIKVNDKTGDQAKYRPLSSDRVMYTTHTAVWDAKNRDGLPECLPLDYKGIQHLFEDVKREPDFGVHEDVPDLELQKLMINSKVTTEQVRKGVAMFFPDQPFAQGSIKDYPSDFVQHIKNTWHDFSNALVNINLEAPI